VVTGNRAEVVARESLQGNYSGAVSRLAAFVLDLVIGSLLFTLALAAVNFSASIVVRHPVHWSRSNSVIIAAISVVWLFLYFAYCWATTGRTPGMTLLGIRVVRADGAHAEAWRAIVRTLILPISVALFWLSLPLILLQRAHQAPHDLVAGTAVVYAWDARAAKWRLLARASAPGQPIPGAQPSATGDAAPVGQPKDDEVGETAVSGTAVEAPEGI
jgi:uncharacterized RDD family membrane protein YckC